MKYTLRSFLFLSYLFFSFNLFAIDYVFTGEGNWNNAMNWSSRLIPPGTLPNGSRIFIIGNAIIGSGCTQGTTCADPGNFTFNRGFVYIEEGASLTLNNYTNFTNKGMIRVLGTLINNTNFEANDTSMLFIHGTFINKKNYGNQLFVNIENGGVFENQPGAIFTNTGYGSTPFPQTGKLTIHPGGTFKNGGTAILRAGILSNSGTLVNEGTLSGVVTVDGSLTNVGILAPGNSPGVYTVSGDYTAATTAIHNFEVAGTSTTEYDQLNVGGNVYLNGTLNVSLIDGFVPSSGDLDLPIITGTINGTFTNSNLPSQYQLIYNTNSVVLRVSATLPVIFSQIDVKKGISGADVGWTVQTEVGVSHYEVERSRNGRDFTWIASITAASRGNYHFTDPSTSGLTYYRIKSVDKDGKSQYSAVVKFSVDKPSAELKVFPSPATGTVNIQHASAVQGNRIVITAINGSIVRTTIPAFGTQKTTVDMTNLTRGVYVIYLYDNEAQISSLKFIKQ
ncbi:MAG TPA: T9SS type A sorting domain-containing protein [Flavisolibacter sp.]|jgi:hypothetical protein|nr:T9SS type A sorting domain-containing protein [Flavisolibacter sp.]